MAPIRDPITDPRSPSPATAVDPSRNAARSDDISGSTFRDNTRIHQGDIHVETGYFQSTTEPTSPGHLPASSLDQQWLLRTYESESQRYHKVLMECRCNKTDEPDDFLLGFTNTRKAYTWCQETHSPYLWVHKKKNDSNKGHKHLALCVLQQAIRSKVAEPGHIFTNARLPDAKAVLPKSYSIEKSTLSKNELSEVYSVEIMLLSMVMQAKAARLVVRDTRIDDRPESFVQSLTSILVSALENMGEDRVYVVLDNLFEEDSGDHRKNDQLLETMSDILERVSQNCQLVISARESERTKQCLAEYTSVKSNSEFQECLDSLEVSRADDRRVQIADPAPGSNSWVWDHPALQRLRNSRSGALAIIGKPGSGKSVLAKTIVQDLEKRWVQSKEASGVSLLGEWFYCQRLGKSFTAYMSLLKFILSKFLARKSSFFRYFKPACRRGLPILLRSWAVADLEGVLRAIIEDSIPLVMVIDAVDESKDDCMVKLIESLIQDSRSRTKVIFLSRPIPAFDGTFWKPWTLVLQKENINDIQKAVRYKLIQLENIMDGSKPEYTKGPSIKTHAVLDQAQVTQVALRKVPEKGRGGPRPGLAELEQKIINQAEGVILWVVLVFENLYKLARAKEDPPPIDELLGIVNDFPQELDDFYGQMVKELTNTLSREDLRIALSILKWTNVASQYKKFTLRELWDALAIDHPVNGSSAGQTPPSSITSIRMDINSWGNFGSIIRRLCDSLVEINPPSDDIVLDEEEIGRPRTNLTLWNNFESTIRQLWGLHAKRVLSSKDSFSGGSVIQLMHQTVKEFLTSSSRAGVFSFAEDEALESVLRASTTFVELALPAHLNSILPTGPDTKALWSSYIAKTARHLDDFRLLPFCLQLLRSNAHPATRQMDLMRSALLHKPPWGSKGDYIDELKLFGYIPEIGSIAPVLGFLLFFATETGLKHGALNYLRVIDLNGNQGSFNKAMFLCTIMNAMFRGTIMSLGFYHHLYQLVATWKGKPDCKHCLQYLAKMPNRIYNMNLLMSAFIEGTGKDNKSRVRGYWVGLGVERTIIEKAEQYMALLSECAKDKVLTESQFFTIVKILIRYERVDVEWVWPIIKNKEAIASIMSSLLQSSE